MTAKRHSKLMRALVTKILIKAREKGETMDTKGLYNCVKEAKRGFIPVGHTREGWWKAIGLTLALFGMDDIKEYKQMKALSLSKKEGGVQE